METGPPSATATVQIDAPAERVYALITDLDVLTSLAVEPTEMRWRKGASATAGAVFTGKNRNGGRTWTTTCTVTAATPGRVFGFDVKSSVIPVAHWRYEIVEVDGGCRVTESTWDRRPGWFSGIAGLATGVRDRTTANGEHIKLTLQRLKERAEK
ncbi:polyketide cyclase [Mycobacterium sp. MS1601]|uniref:SRPBCC family protein n=1 Tax=Mycobacterium sp. MS1601 TaxID=1936029 RepID=UPI0009796206|nr:SRPBCC family protein [Mycobacterium sp. MS1601]AQA03470.1 polyketide cyclase [Mycobacterium sp. MS1601]